MESLEDDYSELLTLPSMLSIEECLGMPDLSRSETFRPAKMTRRTLVGAVDDIDVLAECKLWGGPMTSLQYRPWETTFVQPFWADQGQTLLPVTKIPVYSFPGFSVAESAKADMQQSPFKSPRSPRGVKRSRSSSSAVLVKPLTAGLGSALAAVLTATNSGSTAGAACTASSSLQECDDALSTLSGEEPCFSRLSGELELYYPSRDPNCVDRGSNCSNAADSSAVLQLPVCGDGCACPNCELLGIVENSHMWACPPSPPTQRFEPLKSVSKASRPADLSSRLARALKEVTGEDCSAAPTAQRQPKLASAGNAVRRIISFANQRAAEHRNVGHLSLCDGRTLFPQPHAEPLADRELLKHCLRAPEDVLQSRLMGLAESVACGDQARSSFLVSLLKDEASPKGSVMQRVVYYCLDALTAREAGIAGDDYLCPKEVSPWMLHAIEKTVNTLPIMRFCMDFVNSVLCEIPSGTASVHIVDFSMWGGQWRPFFSGLALRPGPTPRLRITAVESPPGMVWGSGPKVPSSVHRQEVMDAAAEAGIVCEHRVVVSTLQCLRAADLQLQEGEPLYIGACMRASQLPDGNLIRSNPRETFLKFLRGLSPRAVALCHFEADYNTPFFLKRFGEVVNRFIGFMDSLEALMGRESLPRQVFEQTILAREILNIIGCEGLERIERCEPLEKWQKRMQDAAFLPAAPSADCVAMLRRQVQSSHRDYELEQVGAGLKLVWRGTPLLNAQAWTCP